MSDHRHVSDFIRESYESYARGEGNSPTNMVYDYMLSGITLVDQEGVDHAKKCYEVSKRRLDEALNRLDSEWIEKYAAHEKKRIQCWESGLQERIKKETWIASHLNFLASWTPPEEFELEKASMVRELEDMLSLDILDHDEIEDPGWQEFKEQELARIQEQTDREERRHNRTVKRFEELSKLVKDLKRSLEKESDPL